MQELTGWGDLRFVMAARGWDHEAWVGSFYPDDLPGEWRLAYYANEFPGVLIPEQTWMAADKDTWEEWGDEVPEGFCFYLEVSSLDEAVAEKLTSCAVTIGEAVKGVVSTDALAEASSQGSFTLGLPFWRVAVGEGGHVRYLNYAGDGRLVQKGGVLIGSEEPPGLVELRQTLEKLDPGEGGTFTPALFITGELPSIEQLRETKTLLELMDMA